MVMSDVACEEIYQNYQSWIKDYIMHGFQEWIKPPPQRSHAPIFGPDILLTEAYY
jgi:hypothetical protein